jgi:hypothetical protein
MITQDLAWRIWCCYREIEVSTNLVKKLSVEMAGDKLPDLRDSFGHRRNLQLGVPSGDNCHRIFDLDANLALAVIRAHIANKNEELLILNEESKHQLKA